MAIKLPTYSSQGKAPNRSGNVVVDNPASLVAKQPDVGGFLKDMGNVMGDYAQAKEDARKKIEAMDVETAQLKDAATITDEFKNRTDFKNFEKEIPERLKANEQKYAGMVQNKQDYERYKPAISLNQARLAISLKNLTDKKMFDFERIKFDTEDMPVWQSSYINAQTPEAREAISSRFAEKAKTMEAIGIINPGDAIKHIKTFAKSGDNLRLNKIAQVSPDEADKMLLDPQKNFPSFNEEDIYKAGIRVEKARGALEREGTKAKKEAYNTKASEAYDRSLLWHRGKRGQDGVPFEQWLDKAHSADEISESTYQSFQNKIEHQKDRALSASLAPPKWSVGDHIRFGKVLQGYLDPNVDKGFDDIASDVKGLPITASGQLAGIVATKPSKERKQVTSTEHNFIMKTLKDAGADANTYEQTITRWNALSKDKPDKELPALAKELVSDLPKDPMQKMIEDAKAKREGKGKAEPAKKTDKKVKTYNPSTGKFE